jgi:hypothetical protein
MTGQRVTRRWLSGCARVGTAIAAFALAGCAGTAGGIVKAYPGSERPASEVAVMQCGFSLAIVAIDDNREFSGKPVTCQFSLLPGKHTFRVRIERKEPGTAGTWVQKGDQVVEYPLRAGQTYALHAFEDKNSPGAWTISISDPVTNKITALKQIRLR